MKNFDLRFLMDLYCKEGPEHVLTIFRKCLFVRLTVCLYNKYSYLTICVYVHVAQTLWALKLENYCLESYEILYKVLYLCELEVISFRA